MARRRVGRPRGSRNRRRRSRSRSRRRPGRPRGSRSRRRSRRGSGMKSMVMKIKHKHGVSLKKAWAIARGGKVKGGSPWIGSPMFGAVPVQVVRPGF